MKLHQLRDFIAVAERGSIRAASRQIGIAQPALTRSIHELERQLGVDLFERQARGTSLTPMGEVLMRRASVIQGELRRAQEEIEQLRGMARGRVSVCLSSVPHIALLPGALKPFRQRYPEVELDLFDGVFQRVESDLREGRLDCYIGPPPRQLPAGFAQEKLFDNIRMIVGRKDHPLAGACSLSELAAAQWISTSVTLRAEEELGPLFASHGLPPPRLAMQAHSSLSYITALAYSDLLAMLPIQWSRFPLTREALQQIHVREPLPGPAICIIRRAALPLTPAAEYFCDMIRRACPPEQAGGADCGRAPIPI